MKTSFLDNPESCKYLKIILTGSNTYAIIRNELIVSDDVIQKNLQKLEKANLIRRKKLSGCGQNRVTIEIFYSGCISFMFLTFFKPYLLEINEKITQLNYRNLDYNDPELIELLISHFKKKLIDEQKEYSIRELFESFIIENGDALTEGLIIGINSYRTNRKFKIKMNKLVKTFQQKLKTNHSGLRTPIKGIFDICCLYYVSELSRKFN